MRVKRKTLVGMESTNGYDDIDLVLGNSGLTQIGGGDPGAFPVVPPPYGGCAGLPAIVNHENCSGTGPTTWTFTPTAGNALILFRSDRAAGGSPDVPTGWTQFDRNTYHGTGSAGMAVYGKTSDGTETSAVWAFASGPCRIVEVSGVDIANVDADHLFTGPSYFVTPLNAPAVTPAAGSPAIVFGWFDLGEDGPLGLTPGPGYTAIFPDSSGGTHPHPLIEYQVVASASGGYAPTCNNPAPFGGAGWDMLSIALWCTGSTSPPAPAQPVPAEFIADGDGTTTLFHTAYPYAAGSIKVWVDGHPILNGLTETDPTTGAFTIDFAPLPAQGDTAAERVTAAYQGSAGAATTILGFGARTIEVTE